MRSHDQVTNATSDGTSSGASPRGPIIRSLPLVYTWLGTLGIVAGLIVIAQFAVDNGVISEFVLPAPTDVWTALIDSLREEDTWSNIYSTALTSAVGLVIAIVVGLLVAGFFASIPRLERSVMPIIVAFQVLPKIAIAPLIILILGFGDVAKTTIVALMCFFPMLVNGMQGFKIRNQEHLELFQSLDASPVEYFWRLRMPSAVPYIFAGMRVAVVFALVGAVVAEFVGNRQGLGYDIIVEGGNFNVPAIFADLIMLMVMGLCFHFVVVWLESRFAFWTADRDSRS